MRSLALLSCSAVLLAGVTALSLLWAQEPPVPVPGGPPGDMPPPVPPAPPPKAEPPGVVRPAAAVVPKEKREVPPAEKVSTLTPLARQMHFGALRGADWLFRMNGIKGRFLYGYLPALQTPLPEDHYLHQARAALALARAARYTGDERYEARALQALLVLLEDTTLDPKDESVRYTTLPPGAVNRLGAAGLLVLAIHELPEPKKDLLDQAEQLNNYIRRQARPDGSLRCREGGKDEDAEADVCLYPGPALRALLCSEGSKGNKEKLALVRKALPHYRAWWRAHKNPDFVASQTAAWAEAYLTTKEAGFAEFVFEMGDWLCGLQYDRIDPDRMLWYGGFQGWGAVGGLAAPPTVTSATYAEALAEACRVAQAKGDADRLKRYRESLERCLQFLTTLQYTDANTQHFADWYRPRLLGAFHVSHRDGTLRIDHTAHAVCALIRYLEEVARPRPR
jgi:hypothetical protein